MNSKFDRHSCVCSKCTNFKETFLKSHIIIYKLLHFEQKINKLNSNKIMEIFDIVRFYKSLSEQGTGDTGKKPTVSFTYKNIHFGFF